MLLSAEKHATVVAAKQRILVTLIGRLAVDRLEQPAIVQQLVAGLCRQGGAGANRVAKALMQRLLPTAVVHRLLSEDFLAGRSARFSEQALRMVLFALMTFPSTYFDLRACAACAVRCASDRTRRVRRAALDVLAVLGQIGSAQLVLDVMREQLLPATGGDQLAGRPHEQLLQLQQQQLLHQRLGAAIKARLSRRQLPQVGADGSVQYALRIPATSQSPPLPAILSSGEMGMGVSELGDGGDDGGATFVNQPLGADVEWIVAGVGSVSPTSLKRRKKGVVADQNAMVNPWLEGDEKR